MSYPAKAVANYFIKRAIKEKDNSLTPMKLLKEIYLAHGWCLSIYNRPLIDEDVQAWVYGPVIDEIFQAFKKWGMSPIKEICTDLALDKNGKLVIDDYDVEFSAEDKRLLDKIWETYKNNTGIDLSNWTHRNGSAWWKAWNTLGGSEHRFFKIPDSLIKEEFDMEAQKDAGNKNKSAA